MKSYRVKEGAKGRILTQYLKCLSSDQIAIYLALNRQERKYKYDVQSVCNENFYF